MRFRNPFKKEESFSEEFLALDLGGKLLKAFLFKVEKDYVRLLGMRKAPRGDDPPAAFREIVEDLRSNFPDLPKMAVVGTSGPFTNAFTTVVRSSLSKRADEIAVQARELALGQAERELRRSLGDPKLSLSELEAEILEVKELERLELYLFTSFGERGYLQELESLVRQGGLSLLGFSSLPFNLVSALSGEEDLNALIVDVGGEKTEISLAFGGELMETKSFWWAFPPEVRDNPASFLDLWVDAVSDALVEFVGAKTFPSRILLTGGGASIPELVERVSNFPWGRDHPFDAVPEVSVPGKDELAGIYAEGLGLDHPEDILPLSLGRVVLRMKEGSEDSEGSENSKEDEN